MNRPWWDYSDDEDSDDYFHPESTTPSKQGESILPYYLKFINLPFSVTEPEIFNFLGLQGPTSNLKLLYTKGKKNKFRGIVVYKVDQKEIGQQLMKLQGQFFKDRQILIDIELDWDQKVPVYKPHSIKRPVFSSTKHRKKRTVK